MKRYSKARLFFFSPMAMAIFLSLVSAQPRQEQFPISIHYYDYDSVNNFFYLDLYKKITRDLNSTQERCEAITAFVAKQRVKKKKKSSNIESSYLTPPQVVLLNKDSYSCGELSLAMATLLYSANYRVRIVDMIADTDPGEDLVTHMVVEVFYKNKWHLFDPTYGVHYRNAEGTVVGYKEIKEDLSHLLNRKPENAIIPDWMPSVYSSGVRDHYYLRTGDTE